jgi:hypothetical protein
MQIQERKVWRKGLIADGEESVKISEDGGIDFSVFLK